MLERIGVDFGGTRIKAALVCGARVKRHEISDTPQAGPSAVLDQLAKTVERLGSSAESVGVAIPGEIDSAGACVRLPNVPGFEGVAIGAELEARLGCRVVVENDATAAALGELRHGWGRTHRSFLLATLGTGVGGGLVIDGSVRRGAHGFAGEIGHLLVDSTQRAWPCACGRYGCMESIAGTRGLLRRYAELGGEAEEISDVAEAARAGSRAGLETFRGMGTALGIGLSQAQKVLDLDALVFTGGISAAFDLIEPSLRAALREHVFGAPTAEIPLLVSELGEHAGVVGAAELGG